MSSDSSKLDSLIGKEIVFDMTSSYVHLGRLTGYDHRYAILEDADVHDLRDTSSTRELYILDSRRYGIRSNRARVLVKLDEIVSVSALEDVLV